MTSSPRSSTEERGEGRGWISLASVKRREIGLELARNWMFKSGVTCADPPIFPRFHLFGAPQRQGRKHA